MSKPFCHHIHLACRDLQGMIEFWEKVFEATFEKFHKFGAIDGAMMDINSGATKLFLKTVPPDKPDYAAPACGFEHLGIMVPDLDATLDLIRSLPNASVTKEPFFSGVRRCAFVAGPEGMLLELLQADA